MIAENWCKRVNVERSQCTIIEQDQHEQPTNNTDLGSVLFVKCVEKYGEVGDFSSFQIHFDSLREKAAVGKIKAQVARSEPR